MRIVFLNVWYGKLKAELHNFITREIGEGADIFAFQEAHEEMRSWAETLLKDFDLYFGYKEVVDDRFPQAIFVRKSFRVVGSGEIQSSPDTGLGMYVTIDYQGRTMTVGNVHGLSSPGNKLDTEARLCQSRDWMNFFETLPGMKIIGGDFNLMPETESLEMWRRNGYQDLIQEFGISSTRNHHVWDRYPDSVQHFSDYVLIKGDCVAKKFFVPTDIISDHQAMVLEID